MRRVYFIRPIGMEGPIKIGSSISPDGRRGTLETWSPFALEIIAEIDGGYDLERRFHAYFKATFQRREWFGWSELMAEAVAAINVGTFDVSTLPEPTNMGKPWIKRKGWTEDQKLRASFGSRCRHAAQRTGYVFPIHITAYRYQDTWREHIPAMEAYFADPQSHGDLCPYFAKRVSAGSPTPGEPSGAGSAMPAPVEAVL